MSDILTVAPPGYKPVHEQSLASLREILADAEQGKVTAFAIVAIGPDFANWMVRTRTSRQDRMNLLGQLTYMMRSLHEDEEAACSRGE